MLVHSFQLVADLVLAYLVVVADVVAEALALASVAEADVASLADAV